MLIYLKINSVQISRSKIKCLISVYSRPCEKALILSNVLKILAIPILILSQQLNVTFTGIEHIQGSDSLKVSVRMNRDLFIRDYQQTIFDDLELDHLRSLRPFPADLANNYLNIKLKIYANKKLVTGKLLKMDENGDDIIFSLLFRVDRKLKVLTVKNLFLNGLRSNVENLTIIKAGKFEKEAKFTPEYNQETFNLK
jgi:hypothetical protein